MKTSFRARTTLFIAAAMLPARSSAQATRVEGGPTTVVVAGVADAATGAPLEGAQVQFPDIKMVARTNWIGETTLRGVPVGKRRILVRKVGYTPADVELFIRGDSLGPVFMLERAAPTLDTVVVAGEWHTARLKEFYIRRAVGFGRFLTDSVLAKEGIRDLAFVLASRFPGLGVVPDFGNNPGHYTLISARARLVGALRGKPSVCSVDIYIDGFVSNMGLQALAPVDLAGAEFYSAESAPVEYKRSTGSCAVLILWTKY